MTFQLHPPRHPDASRRQRVDTSAQPSTAAQTFTATKTFHIPHLAIETSDHYNFNGNRDAPSPPSRHDDKNESLRSPLIGRDKKLSNDTHGVCPATMPSPEPPANDGGAVGGGGGGDDSNPWDKEKKRKFQKCVRSPPLPDHQPLLRALSLSLLPQPASGSARRPYDHVAVNGREETRFGDEKSKHWMTWADLDPGRLGVMICSKSRSEYFDPCQDFAARSIACLNRNGGDRKMCSDYFE